MHDKVRTDTVEKIGQNDGELPFLKQTVVNIKSLFMTSRQYLIINNLLLTKTLLAIISFIPLLALTVFSTLGL